MNDELELVPDEQVQVLAASTDPWVVVFDTLHRAFPDTPSNVWDIKRSPRAYRLILGDVDPADVVRAMRRLGRENEGRFRPGAGALLAAVERDRTAGQPTFDEVYMAIYGRGGVLAARAPRNGKLIPAVERQRLDDEAAATRLACLPPLIVSFVQRRGLRQLRQLKLDDPKHGHLRREDLERAWDAHVKAFIGREVAALTVGARREQGLQRLDPLRALQPADAVAELGGGDR